MALRPRAFEPVLIGAALTLLAFAAPAGAEPQAACGEAVAVEPGDTLHRIAERCGTSVPALLDANPDIADPNLINAGQRLKLPPADEAVSAEALAEEPPEDGGHPVRSGNTLYSIAEELGTTVADVVEANPGLDPASMPIGRIINSPGEERAGAGPPPGEATISVSAGHAMPGEPVSVRASGFPADMAVEIGAGPPQSEFDVIARTRSDSRGMVQESLEVPDWASSHPQLVFIVQTPDARTRVVSEPIRIAEQRDGGGDGTVRLTGRLVDGVECPALSADDGNLYPLALTDGDQFQAGERVEVVGTEAEASICVEGTAIEVQSIRQAQ